MKFFDLKNPPTYYMDGLLNNTAIKWANTPPHQLSSGNMRHVSYIAPSAT